MSELALLVIIIVFSFAIYYLTKVSTKETSFEKILEEQRHSQMSIVDVTSQKQKKPKKRKKKADDEALKKENCGRVTTGFEDKVDNKILQNKCEKKTEYKLGNKKDSENDSKFSQETLVVKEISAKKDTVSTSENNHRTLIIGKKGINSKVKSKKVEKIQQNNVGVDNFCINDIKSVENHEQNTSSKSKCSYKSDHFEKPRQISDNIEKQKQTKVLKAKLSINSDSVTKHEQKPLKSVTKHEQKPLKSVTKHEQKPLKSVTKHEQKPLKGKCIDNSNSVEKEEQNKILKSNLTSNTNNVCSPASLNEINDKETKNKEQQKTDKIKDKNNQKAKKTSLDIVEHITEQVSYNANLKNANQNLDKESETNNALLAKISSLRNDLNSERSRSKSFQEELKSSSALLQQKLNELSSTHKDQISLQANEIRKKLSQEFQLKLTQKEEHLKAENEINIQKYKSNLTEMERQLQQLQSAHQSSEMNCENVRTLLSETQHQLNNLSKERDELFQTCQTYQQHLSNIKEQTSEHEMRLKTHLYDVQQKLKTSESSELQLISKMSQLSEEKEMFEQKLRSYESARDIFSQNQIKLEKIVKENQELENKVQTCKSDIYNLHELLRNKELEIHHLKEENSGISARFRPVTNSKENGVHPNSFSLE
ncbi:hypothetical protein Avbf_01602 [Armadillidium vulgare]|nr:hypothetical protein Avbf_01602 [Armadillidium vulgare]